MSKIYKIIPPEVKSQILAELAIPGSSVSRLAKTHKVSTSYIYNLQKMAPAIKPIDKLGFVELAVKDSGSSELKNASLTFANFSLMLEGEIKTASLIAIIKILEEQAC